MTNKFYELQRVKIYANTQEEQPLTFTFSCYDLYKGCGKGLAAYVKFPEANVVTFCPPFFGKKMKPLNIMCSSSYYKPNNDAVYYWGAYMCSGSDYDASDTI